MERPSSSAQQGDGCMFLCCLPFSHTDLVPTIGPGSKDLMTAPITGLCSLNKKTMKLFVRVSRWGGDESIWPQHTRESRSTGSRMVSGHSWLTYGSPSHSAPSAGSGHSVSQSEGVTYDSSDRNWPITLPVGGLQTTSRPFVGNIAELIQVRRPLP